MIILEGSVLFSLCSKRFWGAKSEDQGFRRLPREKWGEGGGESKNPSYLLSPHFSRGRNAEIPVLRSLLHENDCFAGYVLLCRSQLCFSIDQIR